MRKFLIMLGSLTLLSGCSTTTNELSDEISGDIISNVEDRTLPYYGEFKVIQSAEVQMTIGSNNSIHNKGVVIVQDQVTGCMYLSNDSTYNSLTPLYDETGKVKGCGESIE